MGTQASSGTYQQLEATYFHFTGDKLVSIAEEAAGLGIELFVMDDGWFGKRDNDFSGLGDWFPNEKKLGCTLKELGERITATGMKFGIWFEPEAISEDSDLYREHPEWAVRIPGRLPDLSRDQLVLDLSRQEAQDYIIERMSDVLSNAPISYSFSVPLLFFPSLLYYIDTSFSPYFTLYKIIDKKMFAFCRIEKGRRPIDWGGVSSWFLSAVGRYMSLTR